MKRFKIPTYLALQSLGFGHYAISTTYYGKPISMTTNDMPLIDKIKEGSRSARNEAIKIIRYENRKIK
jgi:hypothetical protein